MSIGAHHTVWILGAGFSKSVGGPLLVDLFRQQMYDDLFRVIGEERAANLTWTQALYNHGASKEHRLWEDPEDFLAFMEAAYADPPHSRKKALVRGVISRRDFDDAIFASSTRGAVSVGVFEPNRSDPLTAVLRAFGTEASWFLEHNPVDQEQWRPYLEWVEHLNPERDSIITFNYDGVLEKLELERKRLEKDRLHIVLPDQSVQPERVPVFKLHGSVDWIRTEAGVGIDTHTVEKGAAPLIAAPGRSKQSLTSTLLKPLWTEAKKRLNQAGAIVLVGYSFPKTDAQARMELLEAIEEDGAAGKTREVHLVLGPDVNHWNHRRVLELVRPRLGRSRRKFVNEIPGPYLSSPSRLAVVHQHSLYGEDFIGDYYSRTLPNPD